MIEQKKLSEINRGVIKACQDVGTFIRREGQAFDRSRIEQKTVFNNLVSYVDKEAEERLVHELRRLLPEAGFITEEGTVVQSDKQEYNWIIDPLDGTTNFLHGLPIYGISVGLIQHREIIAGVIYHLGRDEMFHAVRGGGAFCNDRAIHVSVTQSLDESLLATGFPYHGIEKRDVYLEIIKDFLAKSHGIRRLGSAAIDLAYVACGRLEGFFEYNLNPWDVAAGIMIVQEAGGKVTDFKDGTNALFGGEMCASNKHIHPEMLDVIQQRWKS